MEGGGGGEGVQIRKKGRAGAWKKLDTKKRHLRVRFANY